MANEKVEKKIQAALEIIRPALQMDGGDVEFVDFNAETGVACVRLAGHCATCPMAQMTLTQGVEKEIKKHAPEVKEVVAV
ncbi:hypothetical protein COX69_02020 [Candidatus Falkowbacteria bacterium CG_4_10_14_0_2_um_filter_48_10]|uniref:NIF system FeS cluster assembly NifU C-terminal domain-containing protein n=1 Tax=Candidatus Falkowbacteria bacterium CG23_combo_of_CG06-09_8_20_14_all_49_15 TaxID=1974572 RepID=A0A2G9ZNH7_9BACT|nr:MAG: hypothetical protein COX22_00750 [Candidatus Falkowbacteria bacterium CG23_combo_of_CG06-09_8_20_14_all_49_15]PJA08546.1 MAG: hypothetical protein COX69_02020 [Candidatus Falkowbacteria bacterium CG_4_10_14_0_2_um_filter_48_10]